jgi:hypothetical protein
MPLFDDLNTHDCIQRLRGAARALELGLNNPEGTLTRENFLASARMLGLLLEGQGAWANTASDAQLTELIEKVLSEREKARSAKDWNRADELRDCLKHAGVSVKDTKGGHEWSIERDEIDSYSYFQNVRAAFASGNEARLEKELQAARLAGIHFSQSTALDIAPAWRSKPTKEHVIRVLENALTSIDKNQ